MPPEDHRRSTTVPFPDAASGAVIRFRMADAIAVSTMAEPHDPDGPSWVAKVEDRILRSDGELIVRLLKVGLKQADGLTALTVDWNDTPFTMTAAKLPLLNALFLFVFGKPYAELNEPVAQQLAALAVSPAAQEGEAA